jgi:hypothetical protein
MRPPEEPDEILEQQLELLAELGAMGSDAALVIVCPDIAGFVWSNDPDCWAVLRKWMESGGEPLGFVSVSIIEDDSGGAFYFVATHPLEGLEGDESACNQLEHLARSLIAEVRALAEAGR